MPITSVPLSLTYARSEEVSVFLLPQAANVHTIKAAASKILKIFFITSSVFYRGKVLIC